MVTFGSPMPRQIQFWKGGIMPIHWLWIHYCLLTHVQLHKGERKEGKRLREEEGLVQSLFLPESVTTYWYHIILLINDFNVNLHRFVCLCCSFAEHPREDSQIYIMANIICSEGRREGRERREGERKREREQRRGEMKGSKKQECILKTMARFTCLAA